MTRGSNFLIGAKSPDGLLTPESQVAAGEAALSRTARLIRRILAHYWFAVLLLVCSLAGIIVFAVRDLHGTTQFWTQVVAVAGAFGITAKGIAGSVSVSVPKWSHRSTLLRRLTPLVVHHYVSDLAHVE